MSYENYYYGCGCQKKTPCGCDNSKSDAIPVHAEEGVVIERHFDTNGRAYLVAKLDPATQTP